MEEPTDYQVALEIIEEWKELHDIEEPIRFCNMMLSELPPLPETLRHLLLFCVHFEKPPVFPESLYEIEFHRCDVRITTLPENLIQLKIETSNIYSLPTFPDKLKTLIIINLPIEIQTLHIPSNLRNLVLVNVNVKHINTFPKKLKYIRLKHVPIKELPYLPPSLEDLDCSHLPIKHLPELPSTLINLYIEHLKITKIPSLPNNMEEFDCNSCSIDSLPPLPDSLRELYCRNTKLNSLTVLPHSLQILSIYDNPYISSIPTLPDTLRELYIDNTGITYINFPSNLIELDCRNCYSLLVKRKDTETIQEYHSRWIQYEKVQTHNICHAIKEELMMVCWHPDRVLKMLETGGWDVL
jgi:hypothetical protein